MVRAIGPLLGYVVAAGGMGPVPTIGNWSFADFIPGINATAHDVYMSLRPAAWLVGGIILAGYLINTIVEVVRAAGGSADE